MTTDLGDRYYAASYGSKWAVFDLATDQQVGKPHPTRQAAERSAARRNPKREPMSQSTFSQPDALQSQGDMEKIKRDRWGRPLIAPPGGGKEAGYQRVTTFIKVIESGFGLEQWKLRQVVCGLMNRPDLQKAVQAHAPGYLNDADTDDKKTLDEVCKQALDAAASSGKATIGTALHRITERYDRGQLDPADVPEWAKADLEAYKRATDGIEWLHIERMTVNDDLKVAGTPDRIGRKDGVVRIYDLKTGSFWASSCATQLGVYANSHLYDITTKTRSEHGAATDCGVVIHLPAGTGRARMRQVDIAAGWTVASTIAPAVHAWQKNRDLDLGDLDDTPRLNLVLLVQSATTVEELLGLHQQALLAGEWTDDVKALFSQRKAEITAAA